MSINRNAMHVLALVLALGCDSPVAKPQSIAFADVTDDRVPAELLQPVQGLERAFGVGVAIGDFDGDGRPDVFAVGRGLYRNRPDPRGFRLERVPDAAVDALAASAIGASFGDFDRDGDLDLAICGTGGVHLLANDGQGKFTDITAMAGLQGVAMELSTSVAWGDLNGDGFPDLAVANLGLMDFHEFPSRLFINRRDGSFEPWVDPQAFLVRRAWVVAMSDVDGDGRLDLVLGHDHCLQLIDKTSTDREDAVLLNQGLDERGHPIFVDGLDTLGLRETALATEPPYYCGGGGVGQVLPRSTMGVAFGDPSPRNRFDILFADIARAQLFRSIASNGTYRDVEDAAGLGLRGPSDDPWVLWGGVFLDLDGDGEEEILLGRSRLPGDFLRSPIEPVLLRRHGERFELDNDVFHGMMSARAIVPVDLNLDGNPELLVAPYQDRFHVLENTAIPRAAVRVRLISTVSAPGAAGAAVHVSGPGGELRRMVVAGGQPFSDGDGTVDFVMAGSGPLDLRVNWPSGAVQTIHGISPPMQMPVREPEWIRVSDLHPNADEAVLLTVDVTGANLGGPGTLVEWQDSALRIRAVAGDDGRATIAIPPMGHIGSVAGTIVIAGRPVGAHPAIEYRQRTIPGSAKPSLQLSAKQ